MFIYYHGLATFVYTYKLCPTQEVLPKELHNETDPEEPHDPDEPVPTEPRDERDEYVMDSIVTGGDQMPPAEILQKFFGHCKNMRAIWGIS